MDRTLWNHKHTKNINHVKVENKGKIKPLNPLCAVMKSAKEFTKLDQVRAGKV